MFVYIIVNLETLKIYVGKTTRSDLNKYLREKIWCAQTGRYRGRSHLFASMQKYPSTVWSIHPLFAGRSDEEISTHEILLIKALKTQHPDIGYNICDGGEGHRTSPTLESRAKMSKAAKINCNYLKATQAITGVPRPDNVRAKISKAHSGKCLSDETKRKLRKARLAQPDPRLGTHHSEETKKRISEVKKGSPSAFRGRHHSAKSNEKNRRAHLIDLRGQQFNNVIPVSVVGRSSSGAANWLVQCVVCGAEGIVRSNRIRNGDSRFMKIHAHI
jgi:group I intron endonuclease